MKRFRLSTCLALVLCAARAEAGEVLVGDPINGKKLYAKVCTACHGGTWAPGGDPDLGALWREFEPSLLEKRSGITQADAEREWAELNQAILGANRALRSEEEGAPNDFNRWRTALTDYVEGGLSATLPESWRGGATADVAAAKAAMWTDVVHPYCMGCHRINTKGFDEYESFEGLAAVFQGDQALIDAYTKGDPRNLANRALAFMPQAFLQWQRLNADAVAQGAMADWVQQVSNPAGPTCRVTFRTNGPDWTAPGQDVWITGNSEELGGWNPLGGLELGAPSWPTWQGSIDLPQGQTIEYKATVVTSWNGNVVWEAGANHIVTIPTGTACQATFTTDWRDP